MAVISFGDERPVWGSSARFLYGLVEEALARFGSAPYLTHLNNVMKWRYNAIDMDELSIPEIREFATIIPIYTAKYRTATGPDFAQVTGVEDLLDGLSAKIDAYILEREQSGRIDRIGDLWTLNLMRGTDT